MKSIDVYAMGNAVVDLSAPVDDSVLGELCFPKGSARSISAEESERILARYAPDLGKEAWTAAGSVANSAVIVAEAGGKSALAGRVGDDRYGRFYLDEFGKLQVQFQNPPVAGGRTGTVICFFTPDGERTMPFTLGVAEEFSRRDVERPVIQTAQWILVEAYLLANGAASQEAVLQALRWAKAEKSDYRAQVAFSLSDPEVVHGCRGVIDEILPYTDLLFGNRFEVLALTGEQDFERARQRVERLVPNYVITDGAGGAFIRCHGEEFHMPAAPATRIDATGAGDAFAGAFLYGITHDLSPWGAARAASYLASRVIEQPGARLAGGVREALEMAMCWRPN